MLGDDARALRARGQAEFDRLDAEMTALARDAAGQRRLRRGPPRGRPAPPADRAGDARDVRRVDRAGPAPFLRRDRPGDAAGGRVVRRRPVARCSSARSWASPRTSRRRRSPTAGRATSSSRSRPTAPPRPRSSRGCRTTRTGRSPRPSVHEAYPGHHWHLVMRKAQPVGRPQGLLDALLQRGLGAVRGARRCASAGFFEDPIHELHHLNATLFRAARIIVDTSLHLGEMTFDEAVTFMMDKAAMPEPVATGRGRPLLLVADPGVVVPHGLPRDPRDPRPLPRAARLRDAWRRGTCRSRCCASSTTRSRRPGRCRSASRSARSRRRADARCRAPWPLFDLRLRTPRLVLRSPGDDDLFALLEVARAGVHDADQMPFAVAWTDLAPPAFERSFLQLLLGLPRVLDA